MSYGFIKDLLIAHFPRNSDTGIVHCECGWVDYDMDGEADERWAEHVEKAYNE
jgi:hypothetical protein